MASELMPPPAHRDLEAEAEPKLRPGPVAPLAGTLGLDALDVPVGLPVGLPDPLDGLDAFGAVLAAPCVRPPLGIVNAFSDVPDDMFGPSFWLDGPAGELEGGSAPPPAFPSVCSAPVSMAGAGLRRGDGAPLGRPKAQAVPQLLAAKASCESITEHFTNSFDAGADAVERACASAAAAPLPPLPPCSPSHSETSSSPRRTLDSGRVLSPNSSSNPSPNPSIMSAAAQPEPMQEDACLQDLTLLDPEAQRAAGVSAPAPTGIRVDVLKNALKAANHKIEELHVALRAQTALQSYAQRLEGALADKADEVSALRGQLACAPYPDPLDSPEHPQAIEAELF